MWVSSNLAGVQSTGPSIHFWVCPRTPAVAVIVSCWPSSDCLAALTLTYIAEVCGDVVPVRRDLPIRTTRCQLVLYPPLSCILTLHAKLTPHCSKQECVCVLVPRGVIPQGTFVDHVHPRGIEYTLGQCIGMVSQLIRAGPHSNVPNCVAFHTAVGRSGTVLAVDKWTVLCMYSHSRCDVCICMWDKGRCVHTCLCVLVRLRSEESGLYPTVLVSSSEAGGM